MNTIRLQEPHHLAAFLRALRKARGWTQTELATRLGLAQSRIAEIEKRPERISVEQLLSIVAMLGGSLSGTLPQIFRPVGIAPAENSIGKPTFLVVNEPDQPVKTGTSRKRKDRKTRVRLVTVDTSKAISSNLEKMAKPLMPKGEW